MTIALGVLDAAEAGPENVVLYWNFLWKTLLKEIKIKKIHALQN